MTRDDVVNRLAFHLETVWLASELALIGAVAGAILRREIVMEADDVADFFRGLQADSDARWEAALAELTQQVDRCISEWKAV